MLISESWGEGLLSFPSPRGGREGLLLVLVSGTSVVATTITTAWGVRIGRSGSRSGSFVLTIVIPVVLRSFHRTVVGRGDTLHDVAFTVVAGDLDSRVVQLILQLLSRSEHNTSGGDERRFHVVHVSHRLGRQTEAHNTLALLPDSGGVSAVKGRFGNFARPLY